MSKQGTSSIYPAIQPPPIPTRRRLGSNKPISTVVPPPVPMRVSSLHDNKLSDTLSSIKTPNIVRKNGADTGNGLLNQGTLMSLSPKNGQNSQNDVNPHSYFNDFKDIDFSFPPDSLKQRRSSSLEDLSVTKSVYPDISHVFREIRNEPDITCGPSFTPVQNLQAGQRNSQTFLCAPAQYGWNPNLFGNDLTANKNGSEANFGSKNFSTTINRLHHGANSVATNMPNAVIGQTSNPNTIMVPMPNPPIIGFIYPCAGAPGNPFNSNPNPGNLPNLNPRHVSGFSDDSSLITRSRNSLPRPASWADTLDSADGFSTWTNKNLDGNDDYGMTPTRPSPDTNLIHLPGRPAEEHEYLSLDYFDPLYNRGRRESISAVLKDISFNYSFGEAFPTFGNLVYPSESRPDFLSQYDHAHGKGIFDPKTIDLVFETTNSPSDDRRSKTDIDTDRPQKRPTLSLKTGSVEKLRKRLFIDEESDAFCQMVAELKGEYKSTDSRTNLGYILCPTLDTELLSTSVKIMVYTNYGSEPFKFTSDTDILVEHVISQVLCNESPSRGREWTPDDFILKVYDRALYLKSDIQLGRCTYIHQCLKLDQDIKFEMLDREHVNHPFLRTVDDDIQMLYFPKEYINTDEEAVSRESLDILMDTFYKEVEKLTDQVLQDGNEDIKTKGVYQSVKAICAILAKIETTEITKALDRLERAILDLNKPSSDQQSQSTDKDTVDAIHCAIRCSYVEDLEDSSEKLIIAVKQLIRMYCQTFHTDFIMGTTVGILKDHLEITSLTDNFLVHVATAHRLPPSWTNRMNPKYEEYQVIFSLFHGNKRLAPDVSTSPQKASSSGLCDRILWDECLQFDSTPLCALPKESRLCITLIGLKYPQNNNQDPTNKITRTLGGATIQLFSQRSHLVQGNQLVPLQMGVKADHLMPSCKTLLSDSVLLQVNLPDFDKTIFFPAPNVKKTSDKRPFDALHPEIQDTVLNVLEKESSSVFGAEEMEILWEYRNYLHGYKNILPKILQSVHSWDWRCLPDIYCLLSDWPEIDPMVAFELLLPKYPDLKVREFAVKCIRRINNDDLVDFLPQLIQALKFESYHNCPLSRMLLEQSCKSIRFAHQFFWLLKGVAAQDAAFKRRYELMFVALASVAGDALYQEFKKQEILVKILTSTAENVQTGRDKDGILRRGLESLYERFEERGRLLMPYNPSIEVCGIDIRSCSYFSSNAVPLKLMFKNSNSKADPVYAMYKVGDDLRQDMLTLQMINIMDQLWLKNRLDLKMITFSCLATGPKKGIVELITESETLRKIQVSCGVTGSFKDRPIKEWLQRHNPTELEYRKAVENFTYSCAGYCVAMYVLGVGDRHNDNIMLKQSGHMFHIDFSKFLGDSQMFGNFKRDRVPFVLTSDMVYVINDGDKQTGQFQHFIDLCSQAFNIIRKHHDLFYSLFMLMSRSGIPGVTETAAQYVKRTLQPGQTDAQASAMFTRMIEESIKSVFTQFNFFIHNLAQLKFSSHNEGALLSFVPKTYSMCTDGKIKRVKLFSIQKRYTPEKRYIYIFQIERERQKVPSYIFRMFAEFVEFRDKLATMFPLIQWPNFSTRMVFGRSNIRSVAESRKVEIEQFLEYLLVKAPEISQCDLVYTFFHTLLRDEQEEASKLKVAKLREPIISQPLPNMSGIQGDIKLSLLYRKDVLHVMIIHVRNLTSRGTDTPSPYVKTYLLPDPDKHTKRKTKIARSSANPTFNELLEYKMSLEQLKYRILQVTVWDHDVLKENNFLGAVYIKLHNVKLKQEQCHWYPLQKLQMSGSMLS